MFGATADISPEEFEKLTESFLRGLGGSLAEFRTTRREAVAGTDGTYEIDVAVRFEALGAEFLVLVECKYHRSAIKREVVQVLRDRLRAVGAQKGMLFATARFQSGAVEYATAHRIALIHVSKGGTSYVTRSLERPSRQPAISFALPTITGEGNVTYKLAEYASRAEVQALLSWPESST